MEDNKQIIKKYINTPFAYARAQKGLTLLQQNIMVKVVEHLQVYIGKYFKILYCKIPRKTLSL